MCSPHTGPSKKCVRWALGPLLAVNQSLAWRGKASERMYVEKGARGMEVTAEHTFGGGGVSLDKV